MSTSERSRPYGTASSRFRPEKTYDIHHARRDVDYAFVLDGLPHDAKRLCSQCDNVNFASFFDFLQPQSAYTISVSHALANSDCPFCRIVRGAVLDRPAILQASLEQEVECIVQSRCDSSKADLVPYLELCIYLKHTDTIGTPIGQPDDDGYVVSTIAEAGLNARDPLAILEYVGDPTKATTKILTPRDHALDPDEPSSDDDSVTTDGSDFEAAYVQRISAAWRHRKIRKAIPSQVDTDYFKSLLSQPRSRDSEQQLSQINDLNPSEADSLWQLIHTGRFRVIDVETNTVITIRQPASYLTLSYVWGDYVFDERSVLPHIPAQGGGDIAWSVEWAHVPKTIQDAMIFTKRLGERYLWVDSLCIIQTDLEDKRTLIAEMMSIYRYSLLTLVAAAGKDVQAGLPGVRPDSRPQEKPVTFMSGPNEIQLLPRRPEGAGIIPRSTWSTRAWTYQEHMLSRTTMFFTEYEAFMFQGNRGSGEKHFQRALERSADADPVPPTKNQQTADVNLLDALRLSIRPSWPNYTDAVVKFTSRDIKHPGDRLAAFTGLFIRFMQAEMSPTHREALSGLPMQWFYESLFWMPDSDSLKQGTHARVRQDLTSNRYLPSWSWVGWTGPIVLPEYVRQERHSSVIATVIDAANIRCENYHYGILNAWPYEPKPCTIGPNEGIVLHLWAMALQCHFTRHKSFPPWVRCEIRCGEARDPELVAPWIGTIAFDESLAAEYCDGKEHECIVIDQRIMLIQRLGDFSERVAMGKLIPESSRVTGQLQRYGKHMHIMLL